MAELPLNLMPEGRRWAAYTEHEPFSRCFPLALPVQQQAEAARSKRKAHPHNSNAATDEEEETRGRFLPVINHEE